MNSTDSSFIGFISANFPSLLPGPNAGALSVADQVPHGTTIIALSYENGTVLAADRRATIGNMISKRDVQKIFPADEFSGIGFAGAMGIGLELTRLFQLELEHYEKLEGRSLSGEAKAHRLATMIRSNMAAAFQGLAAVPVFVGYDQDLDAGRIFSYDITRSPHHEHQFYAVGSGSPFAPASLKKPHRPRF